MKLWIIVVLVNWNFLFSQNLVPNPSFEDYTTCPDNASQIYLAIPWTAKDNNSVEYFHSCSSTVGVPSHGSIGFQYARTGEAYAGFWAYNGINNNYREYLQVQLNSMLIASQCYLGPAEKLYSLANSTIRVNFMESSARKYEKTFKKPCISSQLC